MIGASINSLIQPKKFKKNWSGESKNQQTPFENQCLIPIQYAQKQIQEMNEKVLPVLNSIKQDYSQEALQNQRLSQEE